MVTRLGSGGITYELRAYAANAASLKFASRGEALAWVRRISAGNVRSLRRALAEVEALVHTLEDDAVVERTAQSLFDGSLVASAEKPAPIPGNALAEAIANLKAAAPAVIEPAPLSFAEEKKPDEKRLTWVEVELVGEDGKPISGERYKIELPDGSVREGRLGSTGTVTLSGIDAGQCKVSFPDLDREAWAPA